MVVQHHAISDGGSGGIENNSNGRSSGMALMVEVAMWKTTVVLLKTVVIE